jgi:hypothetical protein
MIDDCFYYCCVDSILEITIVISWLGDLGWHRPCYHWWISNTITTIDSFPSGPSDRRVPMEIYKSLMDNIELECSKS